MKPTEKCPFCGSAKLVCGKLTSSEHHVGFKPDESTEPRFSLGAVAGFRLRRSAMFCADCCSVWAEAEPQEAHEYLRQYAARPLRTRLLTAKGAPPSE